MILLSLLFWNWVRWCKTNFSPKKKILFSDWTYNGYLNPFLGIFRVQTELEYPPVIYLNAYEIRIHQQKRTACQSSVFAKISCGKTKCLKILRTRRETPRKIVRTQTFKCAYCVIIRNFLFTFFITIYCLYSNFQKKKNWFGLGFRNLENFHNCRVAPI